MKIVILDGGTTNPGDLSWAPITSLGETKIYADTPENLVLERAKEADCIVMNRIVMNKSVLTCLPNLKLIATLSTGYNTIDLNTAALQGVTVCNVPFYCIETVAQQAFALLLELCNHVQAHTHTVRQGNWEESVSMNSSVFPIFELSGKKLGIIGYGNIGKAVARIGRAMGMEILTYSRHPRPSGFGETFLPLEEVLRNSDVVSVHCALNDETRGLLNRERLSLMKPSAYLINTSRGAVIEEEALAQALNDGRLAGAGLDVLTQEPPLPDNPLLTAKNCVITPHIGWSSKDARARLIETVAGNIRSYLEGNPRNTVR